MAHQAGKIEIARIGRIRISFAVKVKTTKVFLGWHFDKLFGSFSGQQPLFFQTLEIDGAGQVFGLQVGILKR